VPPVDADHARGCGPGGSIGGGRGAGRRLGRAGGACSWAGLFVWGGICRAAALISSQCTTHHPAQPAPLSHPSSPPLEPAINTTNTIKTPSTPSTHQQDPVVLMESGHSFERQALEDWWANGHRMCPKTGIPLKSKHLMVAPNVQLKEAIHRCGAQSSDIGPAGMPVRSASVMVEGLGFWECFGLWCYSTADLTHSPQTHPKHRWAEGGDMALRFRPLLRLLSTASDSNNLLQVNRAPLSTAGSVEAKQLQHA